LDKSHTKAVWLMLFAIAFFSAMDLTMKLLSERYSPVQVSALRALSSLPWLLIWCRFFIRVNPVKTNNFKLQLLRGVISIVFLIAGVWVFKLMALSTAYLFFFVAPSIATLLSILFFKEKVGVYRWAAIIGGFIGILIAVLPNQHQFTLFGLLAAFIAVIGYAVSLILAKKLSQTDSDHTTVFYFLFFVSIGASALALPNWKQILLGDLPIIVLMGLFGIVAQYALTAAFRLGDISLIAPLEYTAFIWAILWDLVFWQQYPNFAILIGAVVIILSGLLMMKRQRITSLQDSSELNDEKSVEV